MLELWADSVEPERKGMSRRKMTRMLAPQTSEAPLLKRRPSEYMAEMYYSCQPLETNHPKALELTFEMTNAKTQLLYASDWPHWDFDPPSVSWDLPFLNEEAKRNILGLTAKRIFDLDK